MLNVLIVDDEKYIRNELRYFLEKHEDINICGECSEGEEAMELVKELNPHIVFLDIELQDMNGLLVARKILDDVNPPYIVFATAYDDYALQGFEIDAVDYIVKPFIEERIEKTLDRLRNRIELKEVDGRKTKDKDNIKLNKLCLTKNNKLYLVDIWEIKFIQSQNNEIIVHTKRGTYGCNYTLKELEDRFKENNLIRTHKSYIVNIDFIDEIIPWFNYTYKIKLKGEETEIPVSRNYLKKFKRRLSI
ncbi:LytR/AlgR family response regulator transcription factor [Maledivibacter halophilus]|uniref:Stage 0 sporulation protein A homolog n=1 Tax=Maledivibacter halophilus TaxID=36842 RepID=A0A1T5IQU2_9FIRM|nr:LytTR family DNA-binding domain-containing protein [Maledivibacter halophilus]SKC41539.1 two component transcriptional regulator, LytTR family [Maledivibacter halophilus]